jgi:hypothetical protein
MRGFTEPYFAVLLVVKPGARATFSVILEKVAMDKGFSEK